MADTVQRSMLTHAGALKVLQAALARAEEIGVPMCIAVVNSAGCLLAFLRMDGARFLSFETSVRKARTAAATGEPTGARDPQLALQLALGTDGQYCDLKGGLPIEIDGTVVGGIGVGSGTGAEDVEVGRGGVAALGI